MSLEQYDVQVFGLCGCLMQFYKSSPFTFVDASDELTDQFYDAGLDTAYPFGERQFDIHYSDKTMHLDPVRVKWVKDHIVMGYGDGIQSKELYDFYVEWLRLASID